MYFCKNRLNIHLDEHFVQSNLRFVYLADYQHRGRIEIIAQTRCYTTNYNKAEQLYRQGRFEEAKRYYKAASACPDKPKQNNISARISVCDNAIREATDQRRRQQEAERNGYIRITNIKFGNTDDDGNIISDYGSTLYAPNILYLTPRISYEGLCSSSRSETFDVKIYKPDGSLKIGQALIVRI